MSDDTIQVAVHAYQVIGDLAGATGLLEHPEVQRALDYFGGISTGKHGPRDHFLPWTINETPRTPSVPIVGDIN